jgi:type II secretion system protein H
VGPSCAGFTLLELLLVLTVVAIVLAALLLNLDSLRGSHDLDEGADSVEAMLRMAKAEAANQGRRIRLDFGESGQIRVLWEAQPLEAPGQFTDFTACTWSAFIPSELVKVDRCVLTGDSAYQTVTPAAAQAPSDQAEPLSAVTFYPDGSSDSAVIELSTVSAPDERKAVVELDGLNGIVTTRILTPTEWAEYRELQEEP